MNGIYRIYEDGKLIREVKNKLTLLGRSNALSTMLGLTQSFAGSLGIGISSLSNSDTKVLPTGAVFLNMTDLDYGVGKYPVTSSSLGQDSSQTKDALVYTARITDPSRYTIYELGLFSNQIAGSVDVDALSLLGFESGDSLKETVSSVDYYLDDTSSTYVAGRKATYETDNASYRIGSNAVKLLSGYSVFINDSVFNLTNFYSPDKLKLAFYATGTSVVVEVKFYSGANNNAKFTFNSGAGVVNNAYNVVSLLKSQAVVTGTSMDWSIIDKIEVTVSGGTNAILDGLRIEKTKPIDSIDGLVSRAVLDNSTKIDKQAGSIIDIEYLLTFDLDAG
jgi:hypothetical protein